MGSGTVVELDQAGSGSTSDRAASGPLRRRIDAAVSALSKAAHIFSAEVKSSASRPDQAEAKRRWDAAADNPEGLEFLDRAMQRRKRMDEQGLIHGP